jgi:hypothetical protein
VARPETAISAEALQEAQSNPNFLQGFLSEDEYAAQRGVSVRTCQRDRQLRQAPPYVRFGRRIYYRVEAVRAWLAKNECTLDPRPNGRRSR